MKYNVMRKRNAYIIMILAMLKKRKRRKRKEMKKREDITYIIQTDNENKT